MRKNVWIFIHTHHIGGAEKRFIGLWRTLRGGDVNVNLVVTEDLYAKLKTIKDINQALAEAPENVFFLEYPPHGFTRLRAVYKNFIRRHTMPGDVLHFVGEYPLLYNKNYRQIFSETAPSLRYYNLIGKTVHFFGHLLADRLDVLDPAIFSNASKRLFFKRKRISRTSNSFCDTDVFTAANFRDKKDWLVFLGRFEREKQVLELVKAIPALYNELIHLAKNDLRFFILGHGTLENEIKKIIQQPDYMKVPITFGFRENPNEILKYSKVFFSLQLYNNYPSRSLLEAMAAGNIPVATRVGQTEWIAKPPFSYYVPEYFTTEDLVRTIKEIYSEKEDMLAEKSSMARESVVQEHTVERMGIYYLNLYKQLL